MTTLNSQYAIIEGSTAKWRVDVHTGEIVAMVGKYDLNVVKFNVTGLTGGKTYNIMQVGFWCLMSGTREYSPAPVC